MSDVSAHAERAVEPAGPVVAPVAAPIRRAAAPTLAVGAADDQFEHEADQVAEVVLRSLRANGPRSDSEPSTGRIRRAAAPSAGRPPTDPAGAPRIRRSASSGVIRRQVAFMGYDVRTQRQQLCQRVAQALNVNQKRLDDDTGTIQRLLQQMTEQDDWLDRTLGLLWASPIDYGTVDLDNVQHVAAIYRALVQHLDHDSRMSAFQTSLGEAFDEHRSTLEGEFGDVAFDDVRWEMIRPSRRLWLRDLVMEHRRIPGEDKGPKLEFRFDNVHSVRRIYEAIVTAIVGRRPLDHDRKYPVYEVALLGRGASVAYWLAANGARYKSYEIVVVGQQQPWKPDEPHSRGLKMVNHPMHMISPSHRLLGPDEQERFATPDELSEDVERVIAQYSDNVEDERIVTGGVRKSTEGPFYEIHTERGRIFRARHVVSGLGIGPHRPPSTVDHDNTPLKLNDEDRTERVLDMDEFHRQFNSGGDSPVRRRLEQDGRLRLLLAGPNAGIDVAYYASQDERVEVEWFVSQGPMIVEGFANYGIVKQHVRLWLNYLGNVRIRDEGGQPVIEPQVGQYRGNEETRHRLERDGWTVATKNDQLPPVDFVVYAQGPDVGVIEKVFDPDLLDRLKPNDQRSPQLENERTRTDEHSRRFTEPEDGQRLTRWSVKSGIQQRVWDVLEPTDLYSVSLEVYRRIVAELENEPYLKWNDLGSYVRRPPQAKLGRRIDDRDGSSIEVIGGQSLRLVGGGGRGDPMPEVIDTLNPTVVGNDQLTPIRSRVEALSDYVPPYIGKGKDGGWNPATDDQQMIRIHLAVTYPNIPDTLADRLTQLIIAERHHPETGIRPTVRGKGTREFTEEWELRLRSIAAWFTNTRIRRLAREYLKGQT